MKRNKATKLTQRQFALLQSYARNIFTSRGMFMDEVEFSRLLSIAIDELKAYRKAEAHTITHRSGVRQEEE